MLSAAVLFLLLLHLFNRHMFEVEQIDYEKEMIDWSYITFNDNKVPAIVGYKHRIVKHIIARSIIQHSVGYKYRIAHFWLQVAYSMLSTTGVLKHTIDSIFSGTCRIAQYWLQVA